MTLGFVESLGQRAPQLDIEVGLGDSSDSQPIVAVVEAKGEENAFAFWHTLSQF